MKRLITRDSNKDIIDAFMNNPTFHSVVTLHEIEGSSYTVMLEDAVVRLVAELDDRDKQMIRMASGEIRFEGGGSISFSGDRDEKYVGSSESIMLMPL